MEAFYIKHAETVQRAVRAQHKKSTLFEVDDVEQAVWLFFAENWETIKGYDDAGIKTLAGKAAAKYCTTQRHDFMYFSGSFIYTPDMVERILEESVWVDLGPGVDVEGRVDVQARFAQLKESYQRALFKRYGAKESLTKAESMSALRGLEDLTHRLNTAAQYERVDLVEAANEV